MKRNERVGLASFPAERDRQEQNEPTSPMVASAGHIETVLSRDSVPLNWSLFALKGFLPQIFCLFSTILEHLIP
jgi:hypothetical protein